MGALHEGHAALIRRGEAVARERGGSCVVSIFVNPTQFNEKADFERYPKTLDADVALCREAGAAAVFAPSVGVMYPDERTAPIPSLPRVAVEPGLEDRFRPGHFAGVCQVVLRLFRLVRPAVAVFGEKDWQQLRGVAAMTREQGLAIEIVGHETVRDPDGLAKSSRNRFLSEQEREAALAIPRALRAAQFQSDWRQAEMLMQEELRGRVGRVEYAVIRDGISLGPIGTDMVESRALIAAWVGRTRLIDNTPWPGRN